MSGSGSVRDFLRRAWQVVGAGLLATLGLLYALSAVGRSVGSPALAAAGLAVTLLNVVSVVGAGHGIRLVQTFFGAGPDRAARVAVVRARSQNARDASVVLAVAWVLCGFVVAWLVEDREHFVVAWLVSLPGFVLAPHVAVNSSLMQLADKESRILRYSVVAFALELVTITLLTRSGLASDLMLAGILGAGQLGTVGVLVGYRRHLHHHEHDLWAASRGHGAQWFSAGWARELRLASFTAWDALAIMGYYFVAVSIAGSHSTATAAAVAMVASVNRAVIVPLKSAGLVGGRLVRGAGSSDAHALARSQTTTIAAVMVAAAALVATAGQFSEPLMGVPWSVGSVAFTLGAAQLLLEPWVGFASGQGKVVYDSGFGVQEITGAVLLVAAPLMLGLSLLEPTSPVAYVLPFVIARAVSLATMRRSRRAWVERQTARAA